MCTLLQWIWEWGILVYDSVFIILRGEEPTFLTLALKSVFQPLPAQLVRETGNPAIKHQEVAKRGKTVVG